MTEIKRWKPEDVGCLIASTHGWRAIGYAVQMGIDHGYPTKPSDPLALAAFMQGQEQFTDAFGIQHETSEWMLDQGGLADTVTDWMTENLAPQGHIFHWYEGEFYLSELSTLDD